jgi:hypothetical protein
MKHMCVGEDEVSLLQPVTAVVPQGIRRLPPEEEDVPVLLECPPPHYHGPTGERSPVRPPCRGPARGRSPVGPPCSSLAGGRGGPSPVGQPVAFPSKGRGCLVAVNDNGSDDEGPVPPLVSSSPFFFSKAQDILLGLFCNKHCRFVG